jgi:broad specificity phosphatase PhoE
VASHLADHDVAHVVASSLDRAQETATPIATKHGVAITTDDRVIEAGNHFEGKTFGVGDGSLRHPEHWPRLLNPFRPSWGEPYEQVAARVLAAVNDAAKAADGREAVCVSHQMPIWIARRSIEGRHLWHDPRRRQCALGSVTSLTFVKGDVTDVSYATPSGVGRRQVAGA